MDIKIENHEYNLRQFIHTATRWDLQVIYKTTTESHPFAIMTYQVVNSRSFYEDFRNQLRIEVDKSENGKAFELDIKDRFLLGIKDYYNWYNSHKEEIIKIFGNPNLYSMMLDIMESTEREINKYFPPQQNEPNISENPYPQIFKNGFAFKLFERLFLNFKDSESQLADFSFIYRKMHVDGYLLEHVKAEVFKNWLCKEPFAICLDNSLKTLERCTTPNKEYNYTTTVELIKQTF